MKQKLLKNKALLFIIFMERGPEIKIDEKRAITVPNNYHRFDFILNVLKQLS